MAWQWQVDGFRHEIWIHTMGCWKIVNQYLDPGMASWGLTCPTNSKRRQAQSRGNFLQFAMENHQFE